MKQIVAISVLSAALLPVLASAASTQANALEKQIQALNKQVDQVQAQSKQTTSANLLNLVHVGPVSLADTFSSGRAPQKELLVLDHLKKQKRQKLSFNVFGHVKTFVNYSSFDSAGADESTQTHINLHAMKLATLANINQWFSAYLQIQDSSSAVKQAYVLYGNLNQSPIYFLAGRKEVDFGNFSRVGLIQKPLTTTTFKPGNTDQVMVGLDTDGWQAQFTAFNSGPESTFSKSSSRIITPNNTKDIGNFAANLSYGFGYAGNAFRLGAGYLNGSGFASQSGNRNPVLDLFGTVKHGNLSVLAEFDRTSHKNGSTVTLYNTQAGTSSIVLANASRKIMAWNLSAAYKLPHLISDPSKVTASISQLNFDADEYENQFVASYNVYVYPSLEIGAEYGYSRIENNGAQYLDNTLRAVVELNF